MGLFVGTAGAHVGELLGLGHIHHDVVVVNVLAHHLTGIHLVLGRHEEAAAVLQLVESVGIHRTALQGDERTVDAAVHISLVRLVTLKAVSHDGLALTGREHVGAQADDAPRGNVKADVQAVALALHLSHLALPTRHHINNLARELLGHVHRQFLNGFALLPVDGLINHLRLTHLQFISLASHRFDEHTQVEHAATRHHPVVKAFALAHLQCQVALQLLLQALLDLTACAVLALLAEEGRVVNGKEHAHRRLVDGNRGQRLGLLKVADGVANLEILQPDDGANVAALHLVDLAVAHAFKGMNLLDARLLGRAVAMTNGHVLTFLERTAMYTAHGDASRIA